MLAFKPTARVINVDGGTLAWEAAGLPVARDRKPMSLARKVRMAALTLVLCSILLSVFVHKGLLGIAGLVGAGLVFASMSDICGMGMAMGSMPWNLRRGKRNEFNEELKA